MTAPGLTVIWCSHTRQSLLPPGSASGPAARRPRLLAGAVPRTRGVWSRRLSWRRALHENAAQWPFCFLGLSEDAASTGLMGEQGVK